MSKLTMIDKYKIQQLLSDGMSIENIAKHLHRTEKAVQAYIAKELQPLIDRLGNSNSVVDNIVIPQSNENVINGIPLDVYNAVVYKLKTYGVKDQQAKDVLHKVWLKLATPTNDIETLSALCMQKLEVVQSMITEAAGGRSGVTVMTQTASELTEQKSKARRKVPMNQKDYIYNPKTAK